MRLLVKGFDILFLARPVILIPVWGFSIFGYWCCNRLSNAFEVSILLGKEHISAFGGMMLFSLSVGAVYVFNQLADVEVDAKNEGFPLLLRSGISKRTALWYALILSGMAIIIPLFTGNTALSLFSAATVVWGILYSFKPVYLSGRPFTDFLANAVGYGFIAFGVGWYLSPGKDIFGIAFIRAALPYFLLMCGGSISSTLPDISGDKACGKRTTAVALGIIPAHSMATVFIIASGIVAFINRDTLALIIAVESFFVDILYFILKTRSVMEASYKITGGIAMAVAGVVYPLFIPVAAAVFIATWLYFRLRYGVSYPSLIPVTNASNQS